MPHIIVKLGSGRTEEEKEALVEKLVEAVTSTVNNDPNTVSVAIEEYPLSNWKETVYDIDIANPKGKLYKKPGYKV